MFKHYVPVIDLYAYRHVLRTKITEKIYNLMEEFFINSRLSPVEKWDQVKLVAKKVIRNYGYLYVDWEKRL